MLLHKYRTSVPLPPLPQIIGEISRWGIDTAFGRWWKITNCYWFLGLTQNLSGEGRRRPERRALSLPGGPHHIFLLFLFTGLSISPLVSQVSQAGLISVMCSCSFVCSGWCCCFKLVGVCVILFNLGSFPLLCAHSALSLLSLLLFAQHKSTNTDNSHTQGQHTYTHTHTNIINVWCIQPLLLSFSALCLFI